MDDRAYGALRLLADYYRHELSQAEIKVFRAALDGFPSEAVAWACKQHARTSKWFPKVSELREHMALLETELPDGTRRVDVGQIAVVEQWEMDYASSPPALEG